MRKKFTYIHGVTKKHEVLKEAMKYLSNVSISFTEDERNKFEFICQCINHVVNGYYLDWTDKSGLTEAIQFRLGTATLNDWLYREHGISDCDRSSNRGRKLQATRKAWMRSMQEEFKAKDE